MHLVAILRNLRVDHPPVVIESRREFVVRDVLLKQDLPLEEGIEVLRVVDEVNAGDDLGIAVVAADVRGQIVLAPGQLAGADGQPGVHVEPFLLLALVDDIDDSRHPGGIVAGGRIVDDLDALDIRGGHVVETGLVAESRETRLFAVHQQRDPVAAPEQDPALLIHGYARQTPHRIQERTAAPGDAVREQVHAPVEARFQDFLSSDDDNLFETLSGCLQLDVADIEDGVLVADQDLGCRGPVAQERRGEDIAALGQTVDDESAGLVGECPRDGCARGRWARGRCTRSRCAHDRGGRDCSILFSAGHRHCREMHGLSRAPIDDPARHGRLARRFLRSGPGGDGKKEDRNNHAIHGSVLPRTTRLYGCQGMAVRHSPIIGRTGRPKAYRAIKFGNLKGTVSAAGFDPY